VCTNTHDCCCASAPFAHAGSCSCAAPSSQPSAPWLDGLAALHSKPRSKSSSKAACRPAQEQQARCCCSGRLGCKGGGWQSKAAAAVCCCDAPALVAAAQGLQSLEVRCCLQSTITSDFEFNLACCRIYVVLVCGCVRFSVAVSIFLAAAVRCPESLEKHALDKATVCTTAERLHPHKSAAPES
jgi:hypothetical protein